MKEVAVHEGVVYTPQPKDTRMVVESKLWREEQEKKAAQRLKI